jgi:hypothetical protein
MVDDATIYQFQSFHLYRAKCKTENLFGYLNGYRKVEYNSVSTVKRKKE